MELGLCARVLVQEVLHHGQVLQLERRPTSDVVRAAAHLVRDRDKVRVRVRVRVRARVRVRVRVRVRTRKG